MKFDINNYKSFNDKIKNKNYDFAWFYQDNALICTCLLHEISFIDSDFDENH